MNKEELNKEAEKAVREDITQLLKELVEDSGNVEEEEEDITWEEANEARRKMKRGKAPGEDGLTTDWLKDLDEGNLK